MINVYKVNGWLTNLPWNSVFANVSHYLKSCEHEKDLLKKMECAENVAILYGRAIQLIIQEFDNLWNTML